jgi:hypothetical protein
LHGDLVGVVVESGIVDEPAGGAVSGSHLAHYVFSFLDRGVEVVVESFVAEEASDRSSSVFHVIDDARDLV